MPEDNKNKIVAPKSDPIRKGTREATEAGLTFVPYIGDLIIRIWHYFAPPKIEEDTRIWQEDISERTNEHSDTLTKHEAIITPKRSLSGDAALIATRLAKLCDNGKGGKVYDAADFAAVFTPSSIDRSKDAIQELAHFGLVHILPVIFGPVRFRLTQKFYEQIDPQVMGFNPKDDAKELANLMLADESLGAVPKLHQKIGWERRRLNPALQYLIDNCVGETSVSHENQAEYPTMYFMRGPRQKAALRLFVEPTA